MSERDDLHAQIAQQLFGFTVQPGVHGLTLWHDAAGTLHHAIPAYTTDPAATALVWQWVERRCGPLLHGVHVTYAHDGEEGPFCRCMIVYGRQDASGTGATWPEALCRAALALAEALEGDEKR